MQEILRKLLFIGILSSVGITNLQAQAFYWTGETGDGLWSTPGNWTDETSIPYTLEFPNGSTAEVFFQNPIAGNCTMDVADITIANWNITNYTNTINAEGTTNLEMSSGTLTVTSEATINLGTITSLNIGGLNLTDGSFTAPSGTITHFGGDFILDNPATFMHNGGTIVFNSASSFSYQFGSTSLNNVDVDMTGIMTIADTPLGSASLLITVGQLNLNSGTINSSPSFYIQAEGDVNMENTYGGGNAKLVFANADGVNQTFNITVGAEELYTGDIEINQTGSSPASVILANSYLTLGANGVQTLNLIRGYLNHLGALPIRIYDDAQFTGGNDESTIVSEVACYFTGNKTIPTGSMGQLASIELNIPTLTTGDHILAKYSTSTNYNLFDDVGTGLNNVSKEDQWRVEFVSPASIPTVSTDITLHWSDASNSDIDDLSDLRVAYYNTSLATTEWIEGGNIGTTGSAASGQSGSVSGNTLTLNFGVAYDITFGSASPAVNNLGGLQGETCTNASTTVSTEFFIDQNYPVLNPATLGNTGSCASETVNGSSTWFEYTASGGLIDIQVSNFSGAVDLAIEIFADDCMTLLECANANGAGGDEVIIDFPSSSGTTYKVRVIHLNSPTTDASGGIDLTETVLPSANITPTDGSTDVSINTSIQISFSVPMLNTLGSSITESDITSNIVITDDATGFPVSYTVSSFTAESFDLQPDADLGYLSSYTVEVPANSFQDSGGTGVLSANATFTTENIPTPNIPQDFTVATYSQGGFDLDWTEEVVASNYEVEIATDDSFSSLVSGYNPLTLAAPVSSANISGLADGTTYYARIRATNATGNSNYSNTLTILTLASPPTLNTPLAVSASSFTLSWNSVATASQYEIEVDNNSSFTSSVTVTVDATATTRTFSANPSTSYYYRISTINTSGTSDVSITSSLVTNPVSTAASAQTSDGFTANWSTVNDAATYYLDVSADNFSTLVVDNLNVGNVTSNIVTGLASGTAYEYRIRAENTAGYVSNNSNEILTATLPNAPNALDASNIEDNGFTANWDLLATANGYYLDVSTDNFSTFVTGYNNRDVDNANNFNVIGLNANTEYQYRLRAYTASSTSPNSNIITVNTLPLAPSEPLATDASGVSQNSFTANWDLVAGADSYEIDVATDVNFTSILTSYNALDVGNVSSALINGLNAGTTYYYRIRSVNTGGVSNNSNTINQITIPATPIVTSATSISADGFTANWNVVVGASSYYLDVSDDELFGTFLSGYEDLEVFSNSSTLTGLISGTTYYYRVRAVNDGGSNVTPYSGTRSVVVSSTGGGGVPTPPSGLEAYALSAGEAEIYWFDNSTNETGFEVQRSTTSGSGFSTIASVAADTEFYIDNDAGVGLPENTIFYYRVRALGASANSNYTSEVSVTTIGDVPDAPSEVTGFTLSNSSILITWLDNSDNEDGFIVNRYDEDFNLTSFTVSDTFYVDAGLAGETCYYYDIQAFNSSGQSEFSNFILACTSPVPTAPTGLNAIAVSSNQIELSWNDNSSDEEQFVIEIDDLLDENGFTFLTTTNAGQNTFTIDENSYDLQGNVLYRFRVTAYNNFGASPYSNVASVYTPVDPNVTPPTAPSNLIAESVTLQEIALTWRDNANDELYFTIERSLTGLADDFLPVALVSFNQVAFNNTGLEANTEYFYRIRANNQGGASDYSSVVSAVSECNIVVLIESDIDGGTACNTKNVLLEFSTNVTEGRFQWRRNGRVIPDATLPIYYASQTGDYTCEVSSGECRKSAQKSIIIVPSFTLEISLDEDNRLISSFLGADNYQWYYNYEPIDGANGDNYIPTQPGIYYLITSNDGCSATSNLVEFEITTNLETFDLSTGIKIYPNPSDTDVNFELNSSVRGSYQINLISLKGERITLQEGQKFKNHLAQSLDISRFPQGIYTLEVICGKYRGQKKLFIH